MLTTQRDSLGVKLSASACLWKLYFDTLADYLFEAFNILFSMTGSRTSFPAAHNQCALKALLMAFSSESSAAYEPTFPDPSDPESPSAAESTSPSSVPASSPTAALEPLPRSEMGASVQSHRSHLSVRCFESLLSSLYLTLVS